MKPLPTGGAGSGGIISFPAIAAQIDEYLTAYGSPTTIGANANVPLAPALDMKALTRGFAPSVVSESEHDRNLFCAPRAYLGLVKMGDKFNWEGGNGTQRYDIMDIRGEKHGGVLLFIWFVCDLSKGSG